MKKFFIYIIVTLILQFIVILITGRTIEHGDINAASMYPLAFLLPGILISCGFGLLFLIIENLTKPGYFLILVIISFLISIVLNELIGKNSLLIFRILIITGFLFNLIIFGYKRMKK